MQTRTRELLRCEALELLLELDSEGLPDGPDYAQAKKGAGAGKRRRAGPC